LNTINKEGMNDQLYAEIGKEFADQYGTTMGQMFGKPCLKTETKVFAAFVKDQMEFKIGEGEVNFLKEKYLGSTNWNPSGKRPMKDWLLVSSDFSEDWNQLAKQALEFVDEVNGIER